MFTTAMSLRLLHHSRPWTVASLASARPKGKLDQSLNPSEAVVNTRCTKEATNLKGRVKAEDHYQYQYQYSRVAVQDHAVFEEG